MKKLKFLLLSVFTSMVLFAGCSNANTNYDAITLDDASKITEELGIENNENPFKSGARQFNVTKKSEEEFLVDVNGKNVIIRIPKDTESSEFEPMYVSDASAKYKKIISKSKKLIFQYIDSSTILKDKEGIKKYIDKLSTKEALFTEDDCVVAFFSYKDDSLYINKNVSSYTCEWTIVHEFVHAMSYYTHNFSIEKQEYAFNLFNEALTDIITASLNPKMDNGTVSGYAKYYGLVAPYINLVGEQAIEAYFYSYDNIYKKISHEEFELFVFAIENYYSNNSAVFYDNLIYKWYAAN